MNKVTLTVNDLERILAAIKRDNKCRRSAKNKPIDMIVINTMNNCDIINKVGDSCKVMAIDSDNEELLGFFNF